MKILDVIEFSAAVGKKWERMSWTRSFEVQSFLIRSSEVRVFLTTMRSWDLTSCMHVEGGVQAGPVEVLEDQGLPGTRN